MSALSRGKFVELMAAYGVGSIKAMIVHVLARQTIRFAAMADRRLGQLQQQNVISPLFSGHVETKHVESSSASNQGEEEILALTFDDNTVPSIFSSEGPMYNDLGDCDQCRCKKAIRYEDTSNTSLEDRPAFSSDLGVSVDTCNQGEG
ncbi:hypothetical protein Tco_0105073 [Tanacetum coccineum]